VSNSTTVVVWDETVRGDATGAVLVQDAHGSVQDVDVSDDSLGAALLDSPGGELGNFTARYYSEGAWVNDTGPVTLWNFSARAWATGAYLGNVSSATISGVEARYYAWGVFVADSTSVSVTNVTAQAWAYGEIAEYVDGLSSSLITADFFANGVVANASEGIHIGNVSANLDSNGSWVSNSTDLHVLNVTATDGSNGTGLVNVTDSSFEEIVSEYGSNGTVALNSTNVSESDTLASYDGSIGFAAKNTTNVSLTGVVADPSAAGAWLENVSNATIQDVTANDTSVGLELQNAERIEASHLLSENGSDGLYGSAEGLSVTGITARFSSWGVDVITGSNITASDGQADLASTAVVAQDTVGAALSNLRAANGSTAAGIEYSENVTARNVTAVNYSTGVDLDQTSNATVSNVSATNFSWGVYADDGEDVSTHAVSAQNDSIGVELGNLEFAWVNDTSVTNDSVDVVLVGTASVSILGVSESAAGTSDPWFGPLGPMAAVFTVGTWYTSIDGLEANDTGFGWLDLGSTDAILSDSSVTNSTFGVVWNETQDALVTGLVASQDGIGLQINEGGSGNVVSDSQFLNNTGYGVDITDGTDNLVYYNDFVGNNGATSVYNSAHIQAFSDSATNRFNDSATFGNYWADWHEYVGGVLAPYSVSNGAWDYQPLGGPEGAYAVTFTESGLAAGTWSVTIGTSTLSASAGEPIVFYEYPGTYTFTVPAPLGWTAMPATGTVLVSTFGVAIPIALEPSYTVTVQASGLATGASWTAIVNGVEQSTAGPSLSFAVGPGTVAYQVFSAGYTASSPSGTLSISGNYTLAVQFSPVVTETTYTVWVNETGLPSDTSWSAVFNGVEHTGTSSSLSFSVTGGTYDYQVPSPTGYSPSPSGGSVSISGNYTIDVTFASTTVTEAVQVTESGLPDGTSWAVYVDGRYATGVAGSTPTTLSVSVPANGEYSYQVVPVPGYSVSPSSGTVSVGTSAYAVGVTFSPVTYGVTFSESGLSAGTSWSVTVNGQLYASSGSSVTVYLANGTFTYSYSAVSGYTLSGAAGSGTVSGAPIGVSATYSPTSTTAYVPNATFTTDEAIALAVGALGIAIALFALLRRPKSPGPATAWKEGGGSGSSGGT
jgi:hypothetical protein